MVGQRIVVSDLNDYYSKNQLDHACGILAQNVAKYFDFDVEYY
jgi:hypothetical protein